MGENDYFTALEIQVDSRYLSLYLLLKIEGMFSYWPPSGVQLEKGHWPGRILVWRIGEERTWSWFEVNITWQPMAL